MSKKRSSVVLGAACVAVLFGVRAEAQLRDPRPFRGIFGAPSSPDSPHSLTLTGSLFTAYDESKVDGLVDPQSGLPWVQRSGHYQGADTGLIYAFTRNGDRFGLHGSTGAQLQYYRHSDRSRLLPTYRGDVTFSARLSRAATVAFRQSLAYTSNYNSGLTPRVGDSFGHGIAAWDDPALDVFELRALRSTSSVTVSNRFGRYVTLSGSYFYRSFQLLDEDDALAGSRFFDYGTHAGSVSLMYQRPMTRYATMRLGYGATVSDRRSGTGEPQVLHNIDAGVNYGRALSFSRRTTFGFGTGSAIAVTERDAVPDGRQQTSVRFTGNAALVHQMGQTWTAQLGYMRGFRTHDGFDALYFTDSVRASLNGLISRRLSLSIDGGWANSSIQNQSRGSHRGAAANARLQYGLTRYFALYAQYLYHYYRFSDDVPVDQRLPRRLDRHGGRAGITMSVPLIR